MDTNTTRRSLLRLGTGALAYGAGAAAVAGGLAIAGEAKGAMPQRVSPALDALLRRYAAHDAELSRFYASTFNPAVDRQRAMIAALPHTEVDGSVQNDGRLIWSTANRLDVAQAKGIARIPNAMQSQEAGWQDKRRRARSLYAAHLRRERAVARTGQLSGIDAASKQEASFYAVRRPLKGEIINFPAVSLQDLQAKLAFIERDEGMDGEDLLPLVMDDVRRLSSGEA